MGLCVYCVCVDLRQELAVKQKQDRKPSLSLSVDGEKVESMASHTLSAHSSLLTTPVRTAVGPGSAFHTPPSSYSRSETPHTHTNISLNFSCLMRSKNNNKLNWSSDDCLFMMWCVWFSRRSNRDAVDDISTDFRSQHRRRAAEESRSK